MHRLSLVDFLREDTMIGTSFLRVAAHDDDFGTNAAISYSMSLEEPEYLRVQPLTGWVYVNQPISQVSPRGHQSCVVTLFIGPGRPHRDRRCDIGRVYVNACMSYVNAVSRHIVLMHTNVIHR